MFLLFCLVICCVATPNDPAGSGATADAGSPVDEPPVVTCCGGHDVFGPEGGGRAEVTCADGHWVFGPVDEPARPECTVAVGKVDSIEAVWRNDS